MHIWSDLQKPSGFIFTTGRTLLALRRLIGSFGSDEAAYGGTHVNRDRMSARFVLEVGLGEVEEMSMIVSICSQ